MEKALKIGQKSAKGSFWLLVGSVISIVILSVSTIIMGALIETDEYGLYVVALIPAATILLFQDWGVGTAMSKYCAQYNNIKEEGSLRKFIKVGLIFGITTGLILTLISLSLANIIASSVFGKPEASYFIVLASVSILSTSVLSGTNSIFLGFEKMKFISILAVCQAILQAGLSLFLVFAGYGTLGIVLGYILPSIATSIFGLILLYFGVYKKLDSNAPSSFDTTKTLKLFLGFGIPIGASMIISGMVLQFHQFIMAALLDEIVIGNYKMALNFAGLLSFFTIPISRVLFPAFSKLNFQKETKLVKSIFSSSIKYTSFLLVPATLAVMILSQPIISTLYGDKWLYSPLFLSLVAILRLYALFGMITFPSFLNAQGETFFLLKLNLLNLAVGIPLAVLLIPKFGIPGLILADIVDYIPSLIIMILWTEKRYGIKIDFRSSGKIFLASIVATLPTYLYLSIFAAPAWVLLVSGTVLFISIYLAAAPLLGAVNEKDLNNLRTMVSGLGIVSKVINIFLLLMRKILRAN